MDCIVCEIEEVDPRRVALGYNTCLICGEVEAQKEIDLKKERIAIAYDKGAYQYITDDTDLEELG
jgi:hypothetical protein